MHHKGLEGVFVGISESLGMLLEALQEVLGAL